MPWATIVVATLLTFSGTANGATKRWTPNVDFEDPVNWDAGRVPSTVDVAVFQENSAVPIVVPAAGIDVCEMVLPVNGQLILEPNSHVTVSASSKDMGGCTGQTVKFKRAAPMEWIDPNNWSIENFNPATPHVERIPCEHDTVVFKPSNSFSIIVPDVPINIGALKVGNQTFSQNELDEFLLTDVGDQELKSSSPENDVSMTLTSTNCNDKTGCECGTQQIAQDVCKVASKHCNDKLGCITPVKPFGHCCWICGTYFLINYDPRIFTSETFNRTFEKDTAEMKSLFEKHQLNTYISKIVNGKIQIVMVSSAEYVDKIDEIAKSVYSLLSSYTSVGITNVKMFNSGLSYDVDGMTYGQIALTTCIVIISCMLAIIFYYTDDWKSLLISSGSGHGFVFAKFENDTNDVELINGENRHLQQRKTSFENPTYGAVRHLDQSQPFNEVLSLSYSELTTSTTTNSKMDVELVEADEKPEE